jgi:hypothetical protein
MLTRYLFDWNTCIQIFVPHLYWTCKMFLHVVVKVLIKLSLVEKKSWLSLFRKYPDKSNVIDFDWFNKIFVTLSVIMLLLLFKHGFNIKSTRLPLYNGRVFNDCLYINKTHLILLYSVSPLSPENFWAIVCYFMTFGCRDMANWRVLNSIGFGEIL